MEKHSTQTHGNTGNKHAKRSQRRDQVPPLKVRLTEPERRRLETAAAQANNGKGMTLAKYARKKLGLEGP